MRFIYNWLMSVRVGRTFVGALAAVCTVQIRLGQVLVSE